MSNVDINIMLECKTCGNDIEKCTCGETNITIGNMSNVDINIMLECKTCGNDIEKCTCGETNITIGNLCISAWLLMVAGCIFVVYILAGTSL